MIRRKGIRSSDKVRITFVLPGDHPRAHAKNYVVGDFNDWDKTADPLRKRSNGTYSAVFRLEEGKRYAFRYWSDEGTWFNEEDADAYEPNEFGGENCILIT